MSIEDEPRMTAAEALAMMARVWDAFEQSILEHVRNEVIAEGFDEADVALVIEKYRRWFRERRPARIATAHEMLTAGATSLQ